MKKIWSFNARHISREYKMNEDLTTGGGALKSASIEELQYCNRGYARKTSRWIERGGEKQKQHPMVTTGAEIVTTMRRER